MKRESREAERRKFKRWEVSIPLSIKMPGTAASLPPINVDTDNISPEGLSIIVKIRFADRHVSIQGAEQSLKLVPYLLLDNKILELSIKILPQGKHIKGRGPVKWYDRRLKGECYYLSAGIFLEDMRTEHREKWLEFVRTVAQIHDKYYVHDEDIAILDVKTRAKKAGLWSNACPVPSCESSWKWKGVRRT